MSVEYFCIKDYKLRFYLRKHFQQHFVLSLAVGVTRGQPVVWVHLVQVVTADEGLEHDPLVRFQGRDLTHGVLLQEPVRLILQVNVDNFMSVNEWIRCLTTGLW